VVGPDASGWFGAHPEAAVQDFFDVCEHSLDAMAASARALQLATDGLAAQPELARKAVPLQVADARQRLRLARAGNWQPFEQHLQDLGARYARAGLVFSAWYEVVNSFYNLVAPRAVDTFSAEPARAKGVLLVLGEYMRRSLAIIASDYYATKEQREREIAERHSRVIDAALDPVIEIDERGLVVEFNPAAQRTFGYFKQDVVGRPLSELIIPERFRARHDAGLVRFLATGEARVLGRRVELVAMRADGTELPVELALVVTERLDGTCCFTGFLRDLTEQRSIEESHALRSHALEHAQFGIVISDPITRQIINVNPAYARMVGRDPRELIGAAGEELIADASLATMPEIAQALRERGHHTYELRLRRKDGATLRTLASSSNIATRSGALMSVSTVIDISERDQLEQDRLAAQRALQDSAERLEILSNTSHEFAASSGEIDALLTLVARRLGEIIGDGCAVRLISHDGSWLEPSASFYHADPTRRELARQALGTERQRLGEGIAGRVAQSGLAVLIPVVTAEQLEALIPPAFRAVISDVGLASALSVPLRSRGRTIGAISLLRDPPGNPYTPDDQRFAQELADRAGLAIDNAVLVATLEQRVAKRTAALEAANRELEAFSYMVSHDLRSPLRAIDGFSQVLLSDYEGVLDAKAQHYLQRTRAATKRMSDLIDDLLDLARITRMSPNVGTVELSALAAEVVAELRRREPARAIEVDIASGLSARADARLLRIVLENLLGNAWKFTAKRPDAAIWVGADGDAFYVKDTGAGFDMAYAEKLFMPFERMHSANDYSGTGIGLAIVHRIITLHGGRIWATAEVAKGATFSFTLGGSHGGDQ